MHLIFNRCISKESSFKLCTLYNYNLHTLFILAMSKVHSVNIWNEWHKTDIIGLQLLYADWRMFIRYTCIHIKPARPFVTSHCNLSEDFNIRLNCVNRQGIKWRLRMWLTCEYVFNIDKIVYHLKLFLLKFFNRSLKLGCRL